MKRVVNTVALLTIAFAASVFSPSCTERIEIDLAGTYTRCVIFGSITSDTTSHMIRITRTTDFFNPSANPGVSGADVRIWDGENEFILTEDPNEPGIYLTEPTVYGIPGRTYTLFVDNVDLLGDGILKSFEATSEMLPVANPDSIIVEYRDLWQGWVVQAFAQDPPETEDFYKFLVYQNGKLHSDSLQNINITDDAFFNGSYTNGVVIYYVFGEEGFSAGDTITAEFCGITQDYYKYLIEAQTTSRPSVPLFSAPPANPRSNISNGAFGYFSAYSVSRTSTIIKEE